MGPVIILILVGLVLLLVETLLIPGFAVTGILGIAAMAFGCYLAFVNIGTGAGIAVTLLCIIVTALLIALVLRPSTWKRFSLQTNIDSRADDEPAQKGIEIGSTATAVTRLAPMGTAQFDGGAKAEISSEDGFLDQGTRVVVTGIDDSKIFVKKL